MMKHEIYLLGGNIKNHIWKLISHIDDHGNLAGHTSFKFIDESNDNYYGLWGKEKNETLITKNGSNSLHEERDLRYDKKLMQWDEPNRQYRWDSESGRVAIKRRWTRLWSRKRKFKFKKIKLYGEVGGNKKSWRIILKVRDDGEKMYAYFEF